MAAKKPKKSTGKKPSLTPLPKLKRSLQARVNLYCRLRDCFGNDGAACISCGKWTPFELGDGGHYRPTTHSATRFMEINVHFQCRHCNRYLHANLTGYFRGLERKIGRKALDELDALPKTKIWTREELLELKEYYNERIKSIRAGKLPVGTEGSPGLSMSELFSDIPDPEVVSRESL